MSSISREYIPRSGFKDFQFSANFWKNKIKPGKCGFFTNRPLLSPVPDLRLPSRIIFFNQKIICHFAHLKQWKTFLWCILWDFLRICKSLRRWVFWEFLRILTGSKFRILYKLLTWNNKNPFNYLLFINSFHLLHFHTKNDEV